MGGSDLISALQEAASQLGRTISSALTVTDRQRVNIKSTSILFHGVLNSTAWKKLYEVSENTRTEMTEFLVANNEESINYVDLCIVPKGGTPGDDNMIFPNISISSERYKLIPTNTSLIGGWSLYAKAKAPNRIVLHISGTEIVK